MRRSSPLRSTLIAILQYYLKLVSMIGFPVSIFGEKIIETNYKKLFSGEFEVEIVEEDNKKHNSIAIWTFGAAQYIDGSYSKGSVIGYLITDSARIEFNTIGSEIIMETEFGTRLSIGDLESRKKLLAAISETATHLDGLELRLPTSKISEEKIKPGFDLRKKSER